MILELNHVLIENEPQTLSLMAHAGQVLCLTGGTPERQSRWLLTMMGFVPIRQGFVSIDGEPLSSSSLLAFRSSIAYAPSKLQAAGEVVRYEAPTVHDVFSLKSNRDIAFSDDILAEKMREISTDCSDDRLRLLAIAVLLDKPVLLVDNPLTAAVPYLKKLADGGKTVVVASSVQEVVSACSEVVELT